MLFLSLFLAGFTLGVFAALRIFAPERQEESWDPQHFPRLVLSSLKDSESVLPPKSSFVKAQTNIAGQKLTGTNLPTAA